MPVELSGVVMERGCPPLVVSRRMVTMDSGAMERRDRCSRYSPTVGLGVDAEAVALGATRFFLRNILAADHLRELMSMVSSACCFADRHAVGLLDDMAGDMISECSLRNLMV